MIPACHLFYEMLTSKGQLVVIVSDDYACQIYVTHEPNENRLFPLVHRGKGNRLAPVCYIKQEKLARCDAQ